MCNIVLQQTQNAIEERLQRLEESLHNAHSRENTIQEAASRKTRVVTLEPAKMKRNEALRSKDRCRSKKQQTPPMSSKGDMKVMLCPYSGRNFPGYGATKASSIDTDLGNQDP